MAAFLITAQPLGPIGLDGVGALPGLSGPRRRTGWWLCHWRWPIEGGFVASKELAALDEHDVRSWTFWHRWTILALLAHAFLAVLASQPRGGQPHDDQLIPLTCSEIRSLFTGLRQRPPTPRTSCTGHDGDDDIRPVPEPATTPKQPSHSHNHQVSLED